MFNYQFLIFKSETPPSHSDAGTDDLGSTSFEPSDQGNSHVPSAPYMPVTQGAKMYDLVSRALKKDHEYVSTAIDEVDFMLYRLKSARYSRPHDLLYFSTQ